jgi:hypothetical protein
MLDPLDEVRPRAGVLRGVALPSEHGGWSLTIEPAVLGVLVAPSWSGAALAAAAVLAFMARTPLRYVLVDRWRGRRLRRTVVAERVAAVELAALTALMCFSAVQASGPFWIPFVVALPLVAVGFWFDMRSRSRRLLPELAGTIGIGTVAPAIVLADDGSVALAIGIWCLVSARAIASIPFVRLQLRRFKHQPFRVSTSDCAQAAAVAVAGAAVAVDPQLLAGSVAIVALAGLQVVATRRVAPQAAVLGATQVVLGLLFVLATAVGVDAG